MKIVYFYQYFSTPRGAWGTRAYEFSRRWVAAGHDVTIVTSIYYKSDLTASRPVEDQEFDGIKVKVLNIEINNKQPVWKRILTFIQYGFFASWYAITLPADVVIASSGPITVGIPGLTAAILRRRKLIFEVRDLWPEGAVEMGLLTNTLVIRLAYALEKLCYRTAKLIVTLSSGMAEDINRRYGFTHTLSIPNAADNRLFGQTDVQWQLPDAFQGFKIANYVGNIGKVNNTELILSAAALLDKCGRRDIKIVIIGDGQQRDKIQRSITKQGLDNIVILDLMPKQEMVHWVQHSFCSLVPLLPTPILDTSSPNKLFDSLAAGVPVIQTTNGWIRKFIEENECGLSVDARSPVSLADALIKLADDSDLQGKMGRNAQKLAKDVFDRDVLANKMLAGMTKVHAGEPPE